MDGSTWRSAEIYASFLLAIAVVVVALGVVVRRRRGRGAPLRHVVAPAWTGIARHLAGCGAAPEVVALALAGYEWELPGAQPVRARLPAAIATAADALELPLAEVQRAVMRRAASSEEAAEALAAIRALRPSAEAAPGVARVGELWPEDPERLAEALRSYARMSGLPGAAGG